MLRPGVPAAYCAFLIGRDDSDIIAHGDRILHPLFHGAGSLLRLVQIGDVDEGEDCAFDLVGRRPIRQDSRNKLLIVHAGDPTLDHPQFLESGSSVISHLVILQPVGDIQQRAAHIRRKSG